MRIAVVPQGGNTSYCGGATPSARGDQLVLSLHRLNRIREVDAANFSLIAEAGCVLLDVGWLKSSQLSVAIRRKPSASVRVRFSFQ